MKVKSIILLVYCILIFFASCQKGTEVKASLWDQKIQDLWLEKNGEVGADFDKNTFSGFCFLIKKNNDIYRVYSSSGESTYLHEFKKLSCDSGGLCTFSENIRTGGMQILKVQFNAENKFRVIEPAGNQVDKDGYYIRAPTEDIENLFGCGRKLDENFHRK